MSRFLSARPRIPSSPLPRTALLLLLLALAAASVSPAAAQDLSLPGLGGGRLTESDLAQGATVLVVWASWSPKCRDIVQRVNAIDRRWSGSARVVTVNFQEERSTVQEFLSGQNLAAPVFLDLDGAFSKKNSVTTLPGLLVVRDGATAYRGRLPDDPDQVIGEILQ
ncbi:MAG: TlpA disulfide reductase family protein [Acidobacteriota bacterium]|jgi:thiol-disulfide isomerase/thioredoxin